MGGVGRKEGKARPSLCPTLGCFSKALLRGGRKERLSAIVPLGDPVTCRKQKQHYQPKKGPELEDTEMLT